LLFSSAKDSMKKTVALILCFIVIPVAYFYFSNAGRIKSIDQIYPRYVIGDVENIGTNKGKGNIIALSPYLHTYDFSSAKAFENMLRYYLNFARQKKLLSDSTVVVLPEYFGTWLVALNEKASVYSDTSITDAMQTIVYSNLFSFAKAYLVSTGKDREKEAIFRMKAQKMAYVYQQTLSKLSKEYKLTIVAGSIVLPEPEIENGILKIHPNGKIYNVSVVYDMSGKARSPFIKKVFPINSELGFTSKANNPETPVFITPLGKIAVLICADSWFPQSYTSLNHKDIKAVVSPAYVNTTDVWNAKWKGYDYGTPPDVTQADKNNLTEVEAWKKYAVVARAKPAGIPYALNVFLRGDFWNLGSDGNTLLLKQDSLIEAKDQVEKTGSLINLWLE